MAFSQFRITVRSVWIALKWAGAVVAARARRLTSCNSTALKLRLDLLKAASLGAHRYTAQ